MRLERFLVGVQRWPATAAAVAYGVVAACGLLLPHQCGLTLALTYLAIATFVSCAVAGATCRATSFSTRLLVIGLAFGSTLPATYAAFGDDDNRRWLALVVAVGVSLPHASTRIADGFHDLGLPEVVAALAYVAAGLVVLSAPYAATSLDETAFRRARPLGADTAIGLALWLVAIQCAFHAAAASRYRTAPLAALSVAVGVTCGLWTLASLALGHHLYTYVFPPVGEFVAFSAGTWLVGALLVPIARTGRSFTAVPLDHSIHTDFGRPAETRRA